MLENRSFDHLLGYLKNTDPRVAGLTGNESNRENPNDPTSALVNVSRASSFVMTFDPGHEFHDVQLQLYGPMAGTDPDLPPIANTASNPAAMNGFLFSATQTAVFAGDEKLVMGCFQSNQLPVLSTLAQEFALFNYWYSSLPGPTWPNRFFVHAATSGGLTDSPATAQILEGFSFANGTIYQILEKGEKDWRIYNDGMPQTAGITDLRSEYVDPFTKRFRDFDDFSADVMGGTLPEYTFIEPDYDTGNNYEGGNSMHPLNDIRKGEALVKSVYETLRKSPLWKDTMLIITFDEHGGFYDHQPPPVTVSTGDDTNYANVAYSFKFEQLGVRVPAIVISAYTQKGTVIGSDPKDASTIFDHSSVLATVEKRFGLPALTKRDAAANSLEVALNLNAPRLEAADAPMTLPDPAPDSAVAGAVSLITSGVSSDQAPSGLSENQKAMSALALACHLRITDPKYHVALVNNYQNLQEPKETADYIQQVEKQVAARRQSASAGP